jgi:tetratricopeptide (TPR) repeat protein
MDGLAGCYMMQGRREEAFPLFERELALSRSGLGPDHIDTLSTMHNLGVLLRDSGRYDEAEPLLRDAAEGAVKRLGLDHPKTPTFVNNFADLHAKRGTPQLAEPLLRDLASALRGRAEADPNGFCTQLWYLYNNLKMQGKFAEAERVSRESLDVTARHRPDSWLVPYVRSLVGDMLLKQKRYAEAEPMLIEGYRGMKSRESQAPERIRPIIVDAVRQLVELYEAWDRPAQAAEWRARLTLGAAEGAKP